MDLFYGSFHYQQYIAFIIFKRSLNLKLVCEDDEVIRSQCIAKTILSSTTMSNLGQQHKSHMRNKFNVLILGTYCIQLNITENHHCAEDKLL